MPHQYGGRSADVNGAAEERGGSRCRQDGAVRMAGAMGWEDAREGDLHSLSRNIRNNARRHWGFRLFATRNRAAAFRLVNAGNPRQH